MSAKPFLLKRYRVIVSISLAPGATLESAEIDDEADLGDHEYEVLAKTKNDASEQALDLFHGSVPIGVLDDVEIDTTVTKLGA